MVNDNGELDIVLVWILLNIVYIFGILLALEWWSKSIFLNGYRRKYGHGKSARRAGRHYKTSWTLLQRLFWVPLFKDEKDRYEAKYRWLAYFSWIHDAIGIIASISLNVEYYDFYRFGEIGSFTGVMILAFSYMALWRIVYIPYVARGSWWR